MATKRKAKLIPSKEVMSIPKKPAAPAPKPSAPVASPPVSDSYAKYGKDIESHKQAVAAETPVVKKPSTSVSFNRDNTVTYTDLGGQTFNFSEDEYKNFQRAQEGQGGADLTSPKVAEAFDRVPTTKEEMVARYAETFPEETMPAIEDLEANFNETQKGMEMAKPKPQGDIALIKEAYSPQGLKESKSAMAQAADQISNWVGIATGKRPRKSNSVAQFEEGMTKVSGIINMDIDAVSTGDMRVSDAQDDFESAIKILNEMEAVVAAESDGNPRYWVDKGQELDATIKSMRKKLADQRKELLMASETNRMSQARTGLGFAQPEIAQTSRTPWTAPTEEQ